MSEKTTTLAIMGHPAKHTATESSVVDRLSAAFERSPVPLAQRLQSFPRHVRRQDLSRFLVKAELFKLVLETAGSILECGVFAGGGLFSWAQLSAIYEPYNHTRRVIGFDTFEGFRSVAAEDTLHGSSAHLRAGGLSTHGGILEELQTLASIHDQNRPLGHIPKVELVPGDACETIPRYVAEHPHLLIGLLYLDFDLYEPTKAALKALYPRVVRGGVVAFDELACAEFPGETTAMLEALGIEAGRIRRLPHDPYITYMVRE
jgi:hypothetical protein